VEEWISGWTLVCARCAFQVARYCGMSHCVGVIHGSCVAKIMISMGMKQYIIVIKKHRAKTGL
jgi:hypothetical protein